MNGHYGKSTIRFSINSSKASTNFAWVCIIMVIIFICLLMEKKSLIWKPTTKMLNFKLNFVLVVYLMDLVLPSLERCLLKKLFYFLVDKNDFDKTDIMVQNNIK